MKRLFIKNKIVAGLLALSMAVAGAIPAAPSVYAEETQDVLPQATNVTFETARPLVYNSSISETMSDKDNVRYYKFTLNNACQLDLKGSGSYTYIDIYDATKTQVWEHYTYYNTDFSVTAYLIGGDYYMAFQADHNISFTATLSNLDESFTETQDVNNDMYSNASPVSLKQKYKGVLAHNEDVDYYKFEIPATGTVNYNMVNGAGNTIKIAVYDSAMNSCYTNTIDSGKRGTVPISLAEGTYYLALAKYDRYSVGSYNFSLDFIVKVPDTPQIKSAKNVSGRKLSVSWNAVDGAEGYEVQYATSSNFKSGVKKDDLTSTKETYTGLKKGKTYYVRVRSYVTVNDTYKYSKWSTKKAVKIKK